MEINALKKEIIVMIGMSFSGKSYYVDLHYLPHYQLVSKIHVLKNLKTDKEDPYHDLLDAMKLIVKSHMTKGLPIVIDQNNLTINTIFMWNCLANDFKYDIKAVLIDTPFSVCMDRIKYAFSGAPIPAKLVERMTIEKEKIEELKIILKMKHQSILKNIEYVKLYNENDELKEPNNTITV